MHGMRTGTEYARYLVYPSLQRTCAAVILASQRTCAVVIPASHTPPTHAGAHPLALPVTRPPTAHVLVNVSSLALPPLLSRSQLVSQSVKNGLQKLDPDAYDGYGTTGERWRAHAHAY